MFSFDQLLHMVHEAPFIIAQVQEPTSREGSFLQYVGITILGIILAVILVTFTIRSVIYLTKLITDYRNRSLDKSIFKVVEQDVEKEYKSTQTLEEMLSDEVDHELLTQSEIRTLNDVYKQTLQKNKHLVTQKYEAMQTLQHVDSLRRKNAGRVQDMYNDYMS